MIDVVRARPRWQLLAAIALAVAVVNLWLNRHGGYVYDDWLYFSLSRTRGHFSEGWLTSVYFQHFAPGHRLMFSLQDMLPYGYLVTLAIMCAGLGGATYMLGRIGDMLWGRRPASLIVQVAFGLNIAWVSALNWWSASLQMIPAALAGTTAIYAYLRYREQPRGRWLWVMGLAVPLGLMFYIRPVLVIGYVVLLRVLLLSDSLKPRAIADALWKDRRPLAAILAPTLVYLAYYLSLHTAGEAQQSFTMGQLGEYLKIAWLKVVGPMFVGVRIQQIDHISGFQTGAIVAAQVLVVALLVVTLVRRRSAWRAWAFVLILFLVNTLITAIPRLGPFGPGIAYSLRYYTDLAWLVPLGLGFAVVDRSRAPRLTPVVLAAGGVLLAAFAVLSVRTIQQTNREWPSGAARAWTGVLHRSVSKLPRDAVIADARTPDFVLYKDYPPYNRLSSITVIDHAVRQVDGALPDASKLYTVQPDGGAVPARWTQLAGGDAVTAYRNGSLTVTDGRATVSGGALCVAAASKPAGVNLRPPTPVSVDSSVRARIVGSAAVPVAVPLTRLPAPDFPKRERTDTQITLLPSGLPQLVWLDAPRVTELGMAIPPGAQICLRDVALGSVTAA